MFNVMYIKKNTLSLAHLLLHFYHPFPWKKSHCTHLLAPILWSKNVMYINNLVDAMYIKRILTLLTDFDLPHLCCIHKKIAYVTKLYIYQVSFCVNRGRMFVRLKQKLFYLDCKSPKTYPKFGHVKALCHAIQGYKGHCPPPPNAFHRTKKNIWARLKQIMDLVLFETSFNNLHCPTSPINVRVRAKV